MKKIILLFVFFVLFSLSGCATSHDESKNQTKGTTSYENHSSTSHTDSGSSPIESTTSSVSTSHTDNTETKNSTIISTNQSPTYTDDQIEYARVWLQLGANQEIDTLYIQRIPAGTPIVPSISNSAVFPEDVIQLSGGRKIDGSVTYGSNHNGTINLYNIPNNL